MRIFDNDPTSTASATFLCGRCGHAHGAPENAGPEHCEKCGAHIGKHLLLVEQRENESEEQAIVRGQQEIRTGETGRELRRRQAN